MLKLYCFSLPAVILLSFIGCKKSDEYTIEPVIEFKSLTTAKNINGLDDHLVLKFTFTDGDGDIGIDEDEANFPPFVGEYANNVHIHFFADSTGTGMANWYNDDGRFREVTPEGNTKAIRGEIQKDIFLPNGQTNLPVRLEVYIYDRASHRSNIITTPTIIVTTP